MDQANSLPTPIVIGLYLSSKRKSHIANTWESRRIVGALQYMTVARSGTAYSVDEVSHFMHCSLDTDFKAAKTILMYFKGTLTYGMTLKCFMHPSLVDFSEADWESDVDGGRSMTSYYVFLGSNTVAWSSKKQHTIFPSNIKAE